MTARDAIDQLIEGRRRNALGETLVPMTPAEFAKFQELLGNEFYLVDNLMAGELGLDYTTPDEVAFQRERAGFALEVGDGEWKKLYGVMRPLGYASYENMAYLKTTHGWLVARMTGSATFLLPSDSTYHQSVEAAVAQAKKWIERTQHH